MAEDNVPFSSLDPLGPEYGRGDLPILDTQGIAPFEGDRIEQPKINFPKPEQPQYFNALPRTGGTTYPKQLTKKYTGAPPGPAAPNKDMSFNERRRAKLSMAQGLMSGAASQGTYGGTYNYNAGPAGNAYYKKYHALGQEQFDKIGFTPFQDNEAVFTAQTSKFDEFSRMITHSFMPLAGLGFTSGIKSMGKMLQGDFTSVDADDAKLYEEYAAIGQSSKGGLFGFFNNTAMSFGYTAGIVSEILMEELAAAALTGATLGGGSGALVATTANNVRKIPGIFKTLKGFDRAVDGTKAMKASLKTLDDINNTRSFWSKVKSAADTPIGKFINPADNTFDAIESIVRNSDNLTGLARTTQAVGKTAGGLYRDVRGLNMALSEARLEGGFVQNDTYDKLYSDFYQETGRRPSNKEQELMYKQAKEAGITALGWNAAIIHASNKIMFPNILGPRGGINNFIRAKTRDILDLKAGKIIFENAGKKAAKETVKAGAQKGMKGSFRYVENSLMNSIKGLAKDPVRAIPKVLGYAKANFSEGIQENLQEVISETTKNYYVESYKDPALANFNYAKSLFNTSLAGQFTGKGLETFASGFVMGLFGAPLNQAIPLLSYGKARLFNNEKYQEYVDAKQKVGTQMVNNLNALGADPTEFFNSKITNFAAQHRANIITKNGNTKEVNDAKSESFINQLTTAFETNTLDFFKDHLSSFKQYTPEEFEEALGFEKGTGAEYQARIDDILKHADNMQTTYKNLNQKYPDQINLDDYKKGSDDYNRAAIYKSALAEGKKNAVFFKHTYDDTMSRMYDMANTLLAEKPLKNMSAAEMQSIFEPSRMKSEMEMLRYEVETLRQSGKADDAAKADKIETKISAMDNFLKALNYRSKHYAADPSKIKSDFIDTLTDEQKEQITEEELDELLDRELEAQNMVRRSNESDNKVDSLFERAYKDYLKAVAGVSDDTYFDEAAETAFEKILDYYNLEKESRDMAKYVNLLNNPGDFADLVERHFEWMKKLWENRKDYYKDQIQASMNAFADNALLNQLADENFYVSLDDFERWQQTGQVPDEFFNDQKNIVVREGTAEYDRFSAIFDAAFLARQAGVLDENLNYDEELKKELEELDAQKAQELDALPKVEVTTQLDPVEPSKGSKVTAKDIEDQVQNTEYIDITFKTKDGQDEISLYRSEDGTFNNVNTGALVDLKSMKLDIIDNKRYTQELKPDPEQAQEIENVYKNKKADVINKYAEKKTAQAEAEEETPAAKAETKKAEPAVYSATDDFSTLDKALQDQLQEAFIKNFPEAEEFDDEQFFNELRAFARTSGVARRIIDEYNKKSKLTAATEVTGVPEKLVIKLSGKEVDLTDQPESVIKKNRQLLMMQINNMQNKDKRTPDENLMLAEAKADKAKIDRYLKSRDTKEVSEKMQETINRLQLVFDAQSKLEKINEAYYVENQLMRRVTKAIEELGVTEYSYSDETKVLASVNQTLVKGKSVEDFITDLRTKRPGGFSEYTYNELKRELEKILPTLKGGKPKATKTSTIFQPTEAEIKEEDGVIFGAAGKMGKDSSRQNQDAVFVDNNKGVFIVADGMGGVNKVPFFQPHDAARLMINQFRGVKEKNPFDIIANAYKANNQVTTEEIFKLLQSNGFISDSVKFDNTSFSGLADPTIIAINGLLRILKDPESITDKDSWLTRAVGAVGVKAQRVSNNKYEIEHVGDAVFFVVDKNNNIRQAEGLSTSPFVDGFTWGVDSNGNTSAEPAKKISKYTVELKPGERLVLASDFIETKEAIQDFIKAGFGKSLNFDDFRKNHKNDDASFISIEYQDPSAQTSGDTSSLSDEIRNEVMAIVKEKTYEASRIAGNYIDNQIKNIFDPKIGKAVYDENSITRIAYNNLFGPEGIVTDLKAKFDRNEIAVYTKDIRVFDKDAGIAGEIDIIIVDRDGNVKIVDVKTGEASKWNNFQDKKKFGYQKQKDYILQQTAYANLLFNMTGLNASIGIFPIEITKDDETGKVLSAQSPKVASGLLPGSYEIPLDKSIYQKEIDSIIPRKGVAVESKESAEAANLESIPRQDADDAPSPAVKAQETLEEKPIGVGKGDPDMAAQLAMKIRLAKSKDSIKAAQASLNKAVKKLSAAEVVELSNQLQEKLDSLSEGVLKLNKENLKENDKLIVKTPIFIRGAKWAIYGNTLVITDVSDTGVTVRKARGKKTENLTFAQVNALTTLKDSLEDMKATTEKPLTKKEQDIVAKSKANIDEFVKDFNRLDAIEAEADSMSIEDLEERLFNQNICE
jgi:hypothetical protein